MGEFGGREDDVSDAATKRTVLVVEDEPGIRLALSRALGREGYAVLTAANGADALRLTAERREIDVVVTDLTMPHMTGKQLVARLEAERPGLPIVLMSGYAPALLDGQRMAHHFLQKPFPIERFLRAVADALAGAPASDR